MCLRLRNWVVISVMVIAACGDSAPAAPRADPPTGLGTLPPITAVVAPSTTTAVTTTTQAPRPPIVLGFAGDVSFTHGLDGTDPLADVAELLSAPDLTVVNLETTIAEPDVGAPLDKTYIFRSPPRAVGLLVEAGVDAVSLANNHTLDYGREGLLRTTELLDEADLGYFGAGADRTAAYRPYVAEVGAWTVGFVGLTHVECGWVADDLERWPESAWTCPGFERQTLAAVADASRVADLVVVMVHWGIELDHCPQPYQRDLAADWIEAGADLVIGSHPHVLQGVEQIGDGWVVHSTGNFVFPSARGPSARTAFMTATISEEAISLHATPIEIAAGRPRAMGPTASADMLADLGRWSFGWQFDAATGTVSADGEGICG